MSERNGDGKRVLVLDNYDSFTYNLVQYLGELGAEVEVVRNDVETVDELLAREPDRLVVSPGPCTPAEAGTSVDETVPLPELVLAFAAGHAAMILPLPLGGVGGVDAAMTYALTAVGVPLALALVAVGVYRLFAFWAPTIPALVALLLMPRAGTRLARLDPAPSLR